MKDTGSRHRKWEKSQWTSNIGCGTGRAYGEKRGALRRKNDDGNVRKKGRHKMVGWSEGATKEKGLSGRECTTELHNPSNIDSQNSGPKMKSRPILTDEDDVP